MVAAAAEIVRLLACRTAASTVSCLKTVVLPQAFEAQHKPIGPYRRICQSGVFAMHAWRALRSPATELGRRGLRKQATSQPDLEIRLSPAAVRGRRVAYCILDDILD